MQNKQRVLQQIRNLNESVKTMNNKEWEHCHMCNEHYISKTNTIPTTFYCKNGHSWRNAPPPPGSICVREDDQNWVEDSPGYFLPKDGKKIEKCKCVPSGMCHSWSLIGCPHPHTFVGNSWTCQLNQRVIP